MIVVVTLMVVMNLMSADSRTRTWTRTVGSDSSPDSDSDGLGLGLDQLDLDSDSSKWTRTRTRPIGLVLQHCQGLRSKGAYCRWVNFTGVNLWPQFCSPSPPKKSTILCLRPGLWSGGQCYHTGKVLETLMEVVKCRLVGLGLIRQFKTIYCNFDFILVISKICSRFQEVFWRFHFFFRFNFFSGGFILF